MRLSDERYKGMLTDHINLQNDCDECDTLEEFIEKFGDKYDIEEEDDDFIKVSIDGDIHTIEDNGYGLEVRPSVLVINPISRADISIDLDYYDLKAKEYGY